jgi:hypothetical protein
MFPHEAGKMPHFWRIADVLDLNRALWAYSWINHGSPHLSAHSNTPPPTSPPYLARTPGEICSIHSQGGLGLKAD